MINLALALGAMIEYQEEHGITKCCMTNCQIIFDFLRGSKKKVEVIPCMVELSPGVMMAHLVVTLDGDILEPSYEVLKMPHKRYYRTISELPRGVHPDDLREMISLFLAMSDVARDMNQGECCVSDKSVYHGQWDRIDSVLRSSGTGRVVSGVPSS